MKEKILTIRLYASHPKLVNGFLSNCRHQILIQIGRNLHEYSIALCQFPWNGIIAQML
jgi:hypothetical protein